jgi:hypothetical protein
VIGGELSPRSLISVAPKNSGAQASSPPRDESRLTNAR